MTVYNYLFRNINCGHGESSYYYQPFTTTKELTQEKAKEMILKHNPIAKRLGSEIDDLYIVACDEGYDMKKFKNIYKLSDNIDNNSLDPLPKCMKDWSIIESVGGNY